MEREREFQAIFDGVLDAIVILDDEGRFLDANPPACAFLGQPRKHLLGRSILDFVDPGRRPALKSVWETFRQAGEKRGEFRLENPGGGSRDVQLVARANFVPGRHFAVWRDNTDARRPEGPLRIAEERFARAFRASPLAMTLSTLSEGRVLDANERFLRLTGYRRDELLQSPTLSAALWADPDERSRLLQAVAAERSVSRVSAQIRTKSGDVREIAVSAELLPVEGDPCVLTIFQDETESRTAEQALQRSEREYRNLFESAYDAILIFDAESGEIVRANKHAADTYGISREALVGLKFTQLVVDVPKTEEQIRDTLDRGGLENVEAVHFRSDGRPIDMLVSTSVVDYQGRVAILSINRDVSESKQAQEQIQRMAFHDPLTDLPNRIVFDDRLGRALSQARRGEHRLALLFLDLDRFKDVNDTFGHKIGDLLLQKVAQRLSRLVREVDTVARLGGDEFVLLLTEIGQPEDAGTVAENVLRSFEEEFHLLDSSIKVETSLGISVYPEDGLDAETLMKSADAAMYRAKQEGRKTYRFATPPAAGQPGNASGV